MPYDVKEVRLDPFDPERDVDLVSTWVHSPHVSRWWGDSVKALDEILEKIDIVEAFNSRNVFPWSNSKASDFAAEKGILPGAGSDAHTGYEVGRAYVVIEPFDSAADFLSKLAKAEICGRKTPVVFNLINKVYKIVRGIG